MPTLTTAPGRGAAAVQRLLASAAIAIAVVLCTAGVASAEVAHRVGLEILDAPGSGSYQVLEEAVDENGSVPTSVRMVLRRGGATVADKSVSAANGFALARAEVAPKVGDEVRLYVPSDAATPSRTFVYDATLAPCLGSTSVSGKGLNPVAAKAPTGGASLTKSTAYGAPAEEGTLSISAGRYTATLPRPTVSDDFVQIRLQTSDELSRWYVTATLFRKPAQCGTPPTTEQPPASQPPASPPAAAPVASAADGRIAVDDGPTVNRKGTSVTVPLACAAASLVPCSGSVRLETAAPVATGASTARKRKLVLGTRRFTIAPGSVAKVKVSLSKSARRYLKRHKKVKIKLIATTRNAAGAKVTKTQRLTLRAPRRR